LNTPLRPVLTACLLAGVTLLLYGYRVTAAPANPQELQLVSQARSGTGPLFFQVSAGEWLQPLPVYATSVVNMIGGGDASARVATVVIAAVNVALVFLCARVLFDVRYAGIIAALLLMMTPAHVGFGRSGTDAIVSMPFVLVWLLAFLRFWRVDSTGSILLAGAALGVGIYTNRAAPLTMGFLLVVSLVALKSGGRSLRGVLTLAAAFGAGLIPAAAWFALNLNTYADTFGRWVIHLAHLRSPSEAAQAFFNPQTLSDRSSLYWGFLDPTWLFFDNMLPLVLLPLLMMGLATWRRVLPRHAMVLLVGGALVAPLAGSTFGQPHYMPDALIVLPFAVLLATAGAVALMRSRATSSS